MEKNFEMDLSKNLASISYLFTTTKISSNLILALSTIHHPRKKYVTYN